MTTPISDPKKINSQDIIEVPSSEGSIGSKESEESPKPSLPKTSPKDETSSTKEADSEKARPGSSTQQFQMNFPDSLNEDPNKSNITPHNETHGLVDALPPIYNQLLSNIDFGKILSKPLDKPNTEQAPLPVNFGNIFQTVLGTLSQSALAKEEESNLPQNRSRPSSPNSVEVHSNNSDLSVKVTPAESEKSNENTTPHQTSPREQPRSPSIPKVDADIFKMLNWPELTEELNQKGGLPPKSDPESAEKKKSTHVSPSPVKGLKELMNEFLAEYLLQGFHGKRSSENLVSLFTNKLCRLVMGNTDVLTSISAKVDLRNLACLLLGLAIGRSFGYMCRPLENHCREDSIYGPSIHGLSIHGPIHGPSIHGPPANNQSILNREKVLRDANIVERRLPNGNRVYIQIDNCQIVSEYEIDLLLEEAQSSQSQWSERPPRYPNHNVRHSRSVNQPTTMNNSNNQLDRLINQIVEQEIPNLLNQDNESYRNHRDNRDYRDNNRDYRDNRDNRGHHNCDNRGYQRPKVVRSNLTNLPPNLSNQNSRTIEIPIYIKRL